VTRVKVRCIVRVSCVFPFFVSLLLGGCIESRGGPIAYDVREFPPPEATARIAPMDVLAITVFRAPELSAEYRVSLDGRIEFPLVGDMHASGLTGAEFDDALTRRLAETYFERPDVSVEIRSSTRRNVTVDGSVKRAGSFPVQGPMTLMHAVALAGGMTEDANPRRVAIFRTIGGRRQAAAFDLASIRRGQDPDPAVYAGDVIVIDGSATSAAQRQLVTAIPLLSIFRPY